MMQRLTVAVIGVVLVLNTITTVCNATIVIHNGQLDRQQVSINYDQDDCPPWFNHNRETQSCQCLTYYGARCFNNKTYFLVGFCATLDTQTEILSMGLCPYQGFSIVMYSDHWYGDHWYTPLPDNASELNDYMCGPLNRKGRLCSECKDGYGLATTSIGFQYFECTECAGVWYGIPLFLFLEIFPLTVLYLVILLFQINITSGSITCFIFYSQLVVIAMDRVFGGDDLQVNDVIYATNEHSKWFFSVTLTFYDVWNLRFFRNVLPSFCISSSLKPIHISFLDYISVFYPLCLIFLTWVCVELYDRKFRLLVWLWKPVQRCLKGKEYRIDFINAFASFFLLSFTKTTYQVLLLLVKRRIENRQIHYFGKFSGYIPVVGIDQSVIYGSTEHLLFAVPAAILSFALSLLPALFLTLYPIRPFRVLFSKCRLDGIVINTFLEKFYSCYRTGLDGGRDMRSFAGLYFAARTLLFLSNGIAIVFKISPNDPSFIRGIIIAITALLIALCRPYKKTYMNILDTILLLYFGLLCHLVSAETGFANKILAITFEVMVVLPLLCCVLFLSIKILKLQKTLNSLGKVCKVFYQKCKIKYRHHRNDSGDVDYLNPPLIQQLLIEPTIIENSYGSMNYTA